jgi:hypothetical protein
MKKSLTVMLFLLCVLTVSNIYSSSSIMYKALWKNEHIHFQGNSRRSSWMFMKNGRRATGSSKVVRFVIKANPGYKLLNKQTRIKFKEKWYVFSSKKVKDNYYKTGRVSFKGKFINNDIVTIEYYICNEKSEECIRREKKLKFIFTRRARGSHDIIKVTVKEIK